MVPKVAAKGKSFKGAGLYYLHDKKASTSHRVAFTHTENLPTDNPELALRYMAYTAMRQAELKAASGAARTGRKLAHSVYTYSLSWAPDEAPTHAEMLAAARDSMKALGIDTHEALMVIHTDEPHPHIHVIVNRVHPENGLAAKLSCDQLILSRWAEAYERQQGQIRCEERVINNKRRRELKEKRQNGFVKHRPPIDKAAFHQWRKDRLRAAFQARQSEEKNLSAHHKGQRQFLFDEKERRIEERRLEIRERARPQWAALYRRQAQEKKELRQAQHKAFSRLMYWIRHRKELPSRGLLTGALEAVLGRRDYAGEIEHRHDAERKALSAQMAAQSRAAIRHENRTYKDELAQLQRLQAEETRSLKELHAQQSKDLARAIKEGRDEEQYRAETGHDQEPGFDDEPRHDTGPMSGEFSRRVRKRIRRARKRNGRSKGQGRERED